MTTFAQARKRYKADTQRSSGIYERRCEAGIGHPVAHKRGFLYEAETVHGCGGGCRGWKTQAVQPSLKPCVEPFDTPDTAA